MPYRPTGIGGFGFSVNWEKVPGDEDVARRVIIFLEDRRLLFGKRHSEDELLCVHSAIEIRRFLTEELGRAKAGSSLAQSIAVIRGAMRAFVSAAGLDACNFRYHHGAMTDEFSLALGELRSRVGMQVALIADKYSIEVEPDLAQILPPPPDNDPSFIPGFEDLERPPGPFIIVQRWEDTEFELASGTVQGIWASRSRGVDVQPSVLAALAAVRLVPLAVSLERRKDHDGRGRPTLPPPLGPLRRLAHARVHRPGQVDPARAISSRLCLPHRWVALFSASLRAARRACRLCTFGSPKPDRKRSGRPESLLFEETYCVTRGLGYDGQQEYAADGKNDRQPRRYAVRSAVDAD